MSSAKDTAVADPVEFFGSACSWLGQQFPAIDAARQKSARQQARLANCVDGVAFGDTIGFVAFGSVARLEWTERSDVDWTLLIDGPSDLEHYRTSIEIGRLLDQAGIVRPGASGLFGQITNSHDLLHNIGGLEDTNANMTRRLLLLLESTAVAGTATRENVIRKLLERYVVYGKGVDSVDAANLRPPRFLLNDFVRFWRTMAVDYASKKWLQADNKWALRNVKLRFSRKLIFLKGLLLCLDCRLFPDEWPWNELPVSDYRDHPEHRLQEGLRMLVELPAIDAFCRVARLVGAKESARNALTSYERFLDAIGCEPKREALEATPFESADSDPTFAALRAEGRQFGEAVESLLLESSEKLTRITKEYGVF